jgi:hypothetical protein
MAFHEDDESAVRQMLKKYENKQIKAKDNDNKYKAEDTCLRCQKRGQWASERPEGHEPDWMAKQTCYLCGKVRHIKYGYPQTYVKKVQPTCKPLHDRPPVVKRVWYQSGTTLPKFMREHNSLSLDYFNYYTPLSSQNASTKMTQGHTNSVKRSGLMPINAK